jgi:hypothetical protein
MYLDLIIDTLVKKEPIPIITLVYTKTDFPINETNQSPIEKEIPMINVSILDGLQRTFRLWAYYKTYSCLHTIPATEQLSFLDIRKRIKDKHPIFFDTGVLHTKLLKKLIDVDEQRHISRKIDINNLYKNSTQDFEFWFGLTPDEIVKKMLVLNAGHKAVSSQHQFELLFLHIWRMISDRHADIRLYREKQPKYAQIKKGNREVGEYLFSSVITSLMSLVTERPQRISASLIYQFDLLEEEKTLHCVTEIFCEDFLIKYLNKLRELDQIVLQKNGEDGLKWFGKDTALSGILAGVGLHINAIKLNCNDLLDKTLEALDILKEYFNNNSLNINQFNSHYEQLSAKSVNIGQHIRTIIEKAILGILKGHMLNWDEFFKKGEI